MLSTVLFVVMVDVVTELVRQSVLCQLIYADDLVMMSETIEGLRNMFLDCKKAFDSKGLKVDLGETEMMVLRGITKMVCLNVKLTHVGFAA